MRIDEKTGLTIVGDNIVLIASPTDWIAYTQKLVRRYIPKQLKTFGIPIDFPCFVLSSEVTSKGMIEHRFIYPQDASVLIQKKRELNSRLSLVAGENE